MPPPATPNRGPLAALAETRRALLRARDLDQMLAEACQVAVDVGGMRMAWIGLLDDDPRQVRVAAAAGHVGTYLDGLRIVPADPVLGAGPTGTCIARGVPVVSDDVADDPDMQPWRALALAHGYRSSAALPLRTDDRVVGTLNVYAARTGAIDADHLNVLTALAGDIVIAAERLELVDQLQQAKASLASELEAEQRLVVEMRRLNDLRDAFLSGISHELRTPMTAIRGFAETLRHHEREFDERRRDDLLDRIRANAVRLEALVDDLLDVDRFNRGVSSLTRRPVHVLRLAHEVLAHLPTPGRTLHVGGEECQAQLDTPKVERILDALVSNAVHHTPPGSRIWVWVAPMDGGVQLVVEDDGPGIPPDLQEAVLEPFTRGADPHRGIGIGLTLAAQFTTMHGGTIRLRERDEGGTRVEVVLRG